MNDDVEIPILADLTFEIKNGGLFMIGSNRQLIKKDTFRFLFYYQDQEIYNYVYSDFMIKNKAVFEENGVAIGFYTHTYTLEEYVLRLKRLIKDKHLRNKIGNGMKLLMHELGKVRGELLYKDMQRIL